MRRSVASTKNRGTELDSAFELRLARGFTRVRLAPCFAVSQRAISRLERVVEYLAVPFLVALCEVPQRSADELLGLNPSPKVAAHVQPPEEKRLWRHLKVVAAIPEREQRAVLRIVDTAARAGSDR